MHLMVSDGRYGCMRIKKENILVILGWSAAISLLIIKSHWLFYLGNLKFSKYGIPFRVYEGPSFTLVDQALVIGVAILIGAIMSDAKTLVWTYITSISLSFLTAVIYIFSYIWFILDLKKAFSYAFGWEEVLFLAFINALRFIFPWGVFLSLLGVVVGVFLREFIWNPR